MVMLNNILLQDLIRSFSFYISVGVVSEGGRNEEDNLETKQRVVLPPPVHDAVQKDEGLIVFFPTGMPASGKHSLCQELLNIPGGFGDGRPVHSLSGSLATDGLGEGEFWDRVTSVRRRNQYSILLADKYAESWGKVSQICRNTRAVAIPVIPDSEGTDSHLFSVDELAVFMFRVLQRVNHPGILDKDSAIAGYVLLAFYDDHTIRMNRKQFEDIFHRGFGSVVKMPLLKKDRSPMPDQVRSVLVEGLKLFELERVRQARLDYTERSFAEEWAKWEKQLREILFSNADYLGSIQVPFEAVVKQVYEQISLIAKGERKLAPSTQPRYFEKINYAIVNLPDTQIQRLLDNLVAKYPKFAQFFEDKDMESDQLIVLASRKRNGISDVVSYRRYVSGASLAVEFTALLFTDNMAALEAQCSFDDEKIVSGYPWTHTVIWRRDDLEDSVAESCDNGETGTDRGENLDNETDINLLPHLHSEGKATRFEINPPITVLGKLEFR